MHPGTLRYARSGSRNYSFAALGCTWGPTRTTNLSSASGFGVSLPASYPSGIPFSAFHRRLATLACLLRSSSSPGDRQDAESDRRHSSPRSRRHPTQSLTSRPLAHAGHHVTLKRELAGLQTRSSLEIALTSTTLDNSCCTVKSSNFVILSGENIFFRQTFLKGQ